MSHSSSVITPYDHYEEEFLILADCVRCKISDCGSKPSNDPLELMDIKHELTQCKELLTQMALEARSFIDTGDDDDRQILLAKVEGYRMRWKQLQNQYAAIVEYSNRDELLSKNSNINKDLPISGIQRADRVEATLSQIQKQTNAIERAAKSIQHTEDCASDVEKELRNQRFSTQHAQINAKDMNGLTNQARRSIQTMSRRNRFPWV